MKFVMVPSTQTFYVLLLNWTQEYGKNEGHRSYKLLMKKTEKDSPHCMVKFLSIKYSSQTKCKPSIKIFHWQILYYAYKNTVIKFILKHPYLHN